VEDKLKLNALAARQHALLRTQTIFSAHWQLSLFADESITLGQSLLLSYNSFSVVKVHIPYREYE